MSTLTGVIKAATKLGVEVVPAVSDLWVDNDFLLFTSLPYRIYQGDSSNGLLDIEVSLPPPPRGMSSAGLSSISLKARLIKTVEYGEHHHPLTEAAGLSNISLKARLIKTVEYGEYRHPLTEAAGLENITLKAKLRKLVIDPIIPPEGSVGSFNVEVELV